MKPRMKLLGLLVSLALVTPAHANVREAAFAGTADRTQARTSVFTGATYKLSFDRQGRPSGRAALNIAGMQSAPAASELRIGRGIELARGRTGKAALHIAGADVGQVHRAANLSGGGKTALIVVGVVAVAAVVALVVIDNARCKDEGNTCD